MVTARAKRGPVPLLGDPRYPGFAERYCLDIERFAVEVCGLTPTDQQLEYFESVQQPGSRTTVSSGHGTGKTNAAAVVALWHLLCYKHSNTILSGPKLDTVLGGIRKYAADLKGEIEQGAHKWIAAHLVIAHKSFYIRGYKAQWWVQAKTAPAGKPEAMAGEHRKYLLWLIDEASGVDDKVMGIIMGSLTEEWNRIALMSQPTRASGFFYDTHHSLSRERGGPWHRIRMSSEESPLVSDGFIVEKINQYGGRDDPQYQIKVLGMFPDRLEGQLLSRAQLESCIGRRSAAPSDGWGWVLLVDVGAGEYRDKSVVVQAKVSGHGQAHESDPRKMHVHRVPIMSNRIQPTELIGEIVRLAATLPGCTVMVDGGGMGLFVFKKLEELGLPGLNKVLWGNPCWRKALKEAYFNQRSQAMVSAAKAAQAGWLSIDPRAFNSRADQEEFLSQHRVPYHFDDQARYRIESKGSKEWDGIPSPDALDALSFGFLEQCTFVPNGGQSERGGSAVDDAVDRMLAARRAAQAAAPT